jgi:hypothetical protein
VPDLDGTINLTGKLGHVIIPISKQNTLGLWADQKKLVPKKYDLLVILGPEPQRGMLEKHLKAEIVKYNGTFIGEMSKKNKK